MEKPSSYQDSFPLLDRLRKVSLSHAASTAVEQEPTLDNGVPAVVFAPLVLPHWEAPLHQARMLFIKRSSHLRRHPGQVGFPGGMVETGDTSLLETGFREAEEEVALQRSAVEVLCALPSAAVPSGVQLHPYLVATDQQEFSKQDSEVEAVHLIPLTDLLSCPFRLEFKEWQGKLWRVVYFDLDNLCVWGVTGRIVEHLLENFFDWRPPT